MSTLFKNPVPPYPGWKRRIYHLSRPVTKEDIQALLGNQDLYVRETESGLINIIHKYGLLEIHCIINALRLRYGMIPIRGHIRFNTLKPCWRQDFDRRSVWNIEIDF